MLDGWYDHITALIVSEMFLMKPRELRKYFSPLPGYSLFHEGSRQKLFREEQWKEALTRSEWREGDILIYPVGHPGGYFVMALSKIPLQNLPLQKLPLGWNYFI